LGFSLAIREHLEEISSTPKRELNSKWFRRFIETVAKACLLGIFQVECTHASTKKDAMAASSLGSSKVIETLSTDHVLRSGKLNHKAAMQLKEPKPPGRKAAKNLVLGKIGKTVKRLKRTTGYIIWKTSRYNVRREAGLDTRKIVGVSREETALSEEWRNVSDDRKRELTAEARFVNGDMCNLNDREVMGNAEDDSIPPAGSEPAPVQLLTANRPPHNPWNAGDDQRFISPQLLLTAKRAGCCRTSVIDDVRADHKPVDVRPGLVEDMSKVLAGDEARNVPGYRSPCWMNGICSTKHKDNLTVIQQVHDHLHRLLETMMIQKAKVSGCRE